MSQVFKTLIDSGTSPGAKFGKARIPGDPWALAFIDPVQRTAYYEAFIPPYPYGGTGGGGGCVVPTTGQLWPRGNTQ